MELISVIVPVYKVEPYLDKCVSSIVGQTYKDLEIILVDDGSPDRCPEICDAWAEKDSRIKVIHKKNGGLSDARNVGIAAANGEYIGFVDSDDYISPDMYELLHRRIVDDDCDIAACGFREFFIESQEYYEDKSNNYNCFFDTTDAMEDLLRNKTLRTMVWNKLYSRDLLEGILFEVGKLHEDEFFTYRVIDRSSKVSFISNPLYYYRQRSGSIMAEVNYDHLDLLDAYIARISFLEEKYPNLAVIDKVNFCVACVNFYAEIRLSSDKKLAINRIKKGRKMISFSFDELRMCAWNNFAYVLISKSRVLSCTVKFIREKRGNK